jgi:hypothetical protein
MDVLVMLEETSEHSTVLAHVNSVPSPLNSERPTRDVVTLYGEATSDSLAMALAVVFMVVPDSCVIRWLGKTRGFPKPLEAGWDHARPLRCGRARA